MTLFPPWEARACPNGRIHPLRRNPVAAVTPGKETLPAANNIGHMYFLKGALLLVTRPSLSQSYWFGGRVTRARSRHIGASREAENPGRRSDVAERKLMTIVTLLLFFLKLQSLSSSPLPALPFLTMPVPMPVPVPVGHHLPLEFLCRPCQCNYSIILQGNAELCYLSAACDFGPR